MKGILFIPFCAAIAVFCFCSGVSSSYASQIPNLDRTIQKIRVISTQKGIAGQIECLADNIYYEARGESVRGQTAVAFVTINRTKSGYFPNDVCSVVEERTRQTCQFSWFCERDKRKASRKKILDKLDEELYSKIYDLARKIYYNHDKMKDPTRGSLYYHADYVKVRAKHKKVHVVIGQHIFYSFKNQKG